MILQITFSDWFSCTKTISLFPMVQAKIGTYNGLVVSRRQAIIWSHVALVYRLIYETSLYRDDIYAAWWRRQIETFSVFLAICEGNSPMAGEFPPTKASDAKFWFFLWFAPWINGWVNNRGAGDLRLLRAHYDVIVM